MPPVASMVKSIAHDPCLGIIESVSKLYTNFKSCEEISDRHQTNILIYKSNPKYDIFTLIRWYKVLWWWSQIHNEFKEYEILFW